MFLRTLLGIKSWKKFMVLVLGGIFRVGFKIKIGGAFIVIILYFGLVGMYFSLLGFCLSVIFLGGVYFFKIEVRGFILCF